MGGVASSPPGSITAATTAYQSTLTEEAIGDANGDPFLSKEIGDWTTVAQSAMAILAQLAPPEPNLGTKIDVRV